MLTIWGRLNSVNVQKVVFCADDLQLDYERIEAGLQHGLVGSDSYRAMNPNGLVPTIRDGDFVLWESNAIVRYLCAKHGAGTLWPIHLQTRASADRWMDWQQTTFDKALGPAFHQLVRTPADKRDMALVEAARRKTETLAAILDSHLGEHEWLAGDAFTMAEIALAPSVHRWLHLPLERETRLHLERWYAHVLSRESARKVLTLPLT